jgi:hypothetical protein
MMAQDKAHHSQDPYAQRTKTLTSAVQRLRGWVGSDPSKAPELADALVQLTGHRLAGHGYAAAAADAQDAVRRAAELLAAEGPIGPYTSIADAARYVTAVIQLAAIQAGLGMPDAAARTIESLENIHNQLGDALRRQLEPQTVIWALVCSGRAALASGDIAAANAYADAGRIRLAESGLDEDPDTAYLALDVERLSSDARWAAGKAGQAVALIYAARVRYDDVVDGRLQEPARLSPALLERLAEPLFSVYGDLADRLIATNEVDLGLATRRAVIKLLRGLSQRLGDQARVQLTAALTDLARDLRASGRAVEADAARAEADAATPQDQVADQTHVGQRVSRGAQVVAWTPLARDAAYQVTTTGSPITKIVDLAALQAEQQRRLAAWLAGERPRAREHELQLIDQVRREAEHREAEQAKAEQAQAAQLAAERARVEQEQRLQAAQQAEAQEAERLERKRRREERIEAHRVEAEQREAEQREAERQQAERAELERLQAQIDELERTEKRSREQ